MVSHLARLPQQLRPPVVKGLRGSLVSVWGLFPSRPNLEASQLIGLPGPGSWKGKEMLIPQEKIRPLPQFLSQIWSKLLLNTGQDHKFQPVCTQNSQSMVLNYISQGLIKAKLTRLHTSHLCQSEASIHPNMVPAYMSPAYIPPVCVWSSTYLTQ